MAIITVLFIIVVVFLILNSDSRDSKIKLINSLLPRTLIRGEDARAEYYILNIPIRAHSPFYRNNNSNNELRIKFTTVYFEISNGQFNMGESNIAYGLNELYGIFKKALNHGNEKISINWRTRDLFIYSEEHPRVSEAKYLKLLFSEYQSVSTIVDDLNKEIYQTKKLIETIKDSELYDYQADTYQKGLKILHDSKSRAVEVKEEYSRFLKERTLSFYLEDVEPTVFKLKNSRLNWEEQYQYFNEDFQDLKDMIGEYKQLKGSF